MMNKAALAGGEETGQPKPTKSPVSPTSPRNKQPIRPSAAGLMRAAANIATPCCSLLLGILAFEVVYRIYPFDSIGTRPVDDRPLFYYSAKDAHKRGDFAYDAAKPAGTFRIITVGDSFTYPTYMQFDDAYPKRLERILNLAHPGERKAEVLNFGKMGLSTSREVAEVAKALAYSPDLIVLEITLNDAELHNFHVEAKKNPGKFNFGDFKVTAERYPILSHFRGLSFLYERMHRFGAKNAVSDYYIDSFTEPNNRQTFQNSLTEIKALADKAGVRLAVVIFPMFYTDIDEKYPFQPIHDLLHKDLTDRQIEFLDLRDAFVGIPHTRLNVMVGKDTHPNEIAHRIAAETIYTWMQVGGIIPSDLVAPLYTEVQAGPKPKRKHR